MNWDRFFHHLMRVNAIGIFLLLAGVASTVAYQSWRERLYWASHQSEWAKDAKHDTLYTGNKLNTPNGSVVAYTVKDGDEMGRRQGSNVTLVNTKTGASLTIAPGNSSVVNWEVLFAPGSRDRVAVAYTASVATSEQFKKGRLDLVIGTLPNLQQSTVARNILAADLPTVQGDGSMAIIMWPEIDKASFVTVDLKNGRIISRNQVPLPRIGKGITKGHADNFDPGQLPRGARNDSRTEESLGF